MFNLEGSFMIGIDELKHQGCRHLLITKAHPGGRFCWKKATIIYFVQELGSLTDDLPYIDYRCGKHAKRRKIEIMSPKFGPPFKRTWIRLSPEEYLVYEVMSS
jgi:hypothetical protein